MSTASLLRKRSEPEALVGLPLSSAGPGLLRAYRDATTDLVAEDLPGRQFAALHQS
ncbi:hypothetical protein [Streptomyces sp. NPDC054874]